MDLFFTAKYNIFPVLLITSKHIMYIQFDISTLPFTVSGLNRQLFFRFFISTTNKSNSKGQQERK